MDLKTVGQEAEHDDTIVELELKDRHGKPYPKDPPVLQLVGEYSKQYRKQERALTKKARDDMRTGREWSDEQWGTILVAAGVVGWKNVTVDGKPAQFSVDGVMEWFLAAPWHAKQAERAIRGHSDFFGDGSTG